jgi:hypothetical protein
MENSEPAHDVPPDTNFFDSWNVGEVRHGALARALADALS